MLRLSAFVLLGMSNLAFAQDIPPSKPITPMETMFLKMQSAYVSAIGVPPIPPVPALPELPIVKDKPPHADKR